MVQALPQPIDFEEFIQWYPHPRDRRYELHRGRIVEMPKPKGKHSEIAGFLSGQLFLQIYQQNLPYIIPRESIIRAESESGYEPDVIVLDTQALESKPQWKSSSIITQGQSVRLVIEAVKRQAIPLVFSFNV